MIDDTKKQEDSMEDILASIRETVEEEVGKPEEEENSGESALSGVEEEADETALDNPHNDNPTVENVDEAEETEEAEEAVDVEEASVQPEEELEEETVKEDEAATNEEAQEVEQAEAKINPEEAVEPTADENQAEQTLADGALAEPVFKEETPQTNNTFDNDDDVLELTDVVDEVDSEEDMIDVDKFAQSGEMTMADKGAVQMSRDNYNEYEGDIDVDVDGIMSELKEDGSLETESKTSLNEDEAAQFIANNNVEEPAENVAEESVKEEAKTAETITQTVTEKAKEQIANKVFLPTTPSAKGLQVSFPAEVLAEALRPLVTDWINDNLSNIVERLVKEEISKLVDK